MTTTDTALNFRTELIDLLTRDAVLAQVASLAPGSDGLAAQLLLLPKRLTDALRGELSRQETWSSEQWVRTAEDDVALVPEAEFDATEPSRRVSSSDAMYIVPDRAHLIHSFMSAVQSNDVSDSFSTAYGSPVSFRSSDIARYRHRQYLRRHSDTFDDRRFGLVFFLGPHRHIDCGGELVVEAPGGECVVVRPEEGHLALLRISPGYLHNVCQIRSTSWIRYSIAVHFGLAGHTGS